MGLIDIPRLGGARLVQSQESSPQISINQTYSQLDPINRLDTVRSITSHTEHPFWYTARITTTMDAFEVKEQIIIGLLPGDRYGREKELAVNKKETSRSIFGRSHWRRCDRQGERFSPQRQPRPGSTIRLYPFGLHWKSQSQGAQQHMNHTLAVGESETVTLMHADFLWC